MPWRILTYKILPKLTEVLTTHRKQLQNATELSCTSQPLSVTGKNYSNTPLHSDRRMWPHWGASHSRNPKRPFFSDTSRTIQDFYGSPPTANLVPGIIFSPANNESLWILIIWEALLMYLCLQMSNQHLMSMKWFHIELSISQASTSPRKETHLFILSSTLGYSLPKQWELDMRKQQDIFPITYSPINHSSLWNLATGHWSLLGKC